MPHVIIKLYSGKSDAQKSKLAEEVTAAVMAALNYREESISVGIEDIEPEAWAAAVFKPDILNKSKTIFKKPGYNPF